MSNFPATMQSFALLAFDRIPIVGGRCGADMLETLARLPAKS
jgi:hypothetical protein